MRLQQLKLVFVVTLVIHLVNFERLNAHLVVFSGVAAIGLTAQSGLTGIFPHNYYRPDR